jgi:flagellar assembly protein FliH
MSSFDGHVEAPAWGEPPVSADPSLEPLRDAARVAGHSEGHAEGYRQGHDAGLLAGRQQAQVEVDRLKALAVAWQTAVRQVDANMADEMLDLALQFSQVILRRALVVQPELVLPIVRELLRDQVASQHQATLRLHPDDLMLVSDRLGAECDFAGWKLLADPAITPGGCLLQTRHGEVDARIETRWRELTRTLDAATPWLERA